MTVDPVVEDGQLSVSPRKHELNANALNPLRIKEILNGNSTFTLYRRDRQYLFFGLMSSD